jgi:plastocyanin
MPSAPSGRPPSCRPPAYRFGAGWWRAAVTAIVGLFSTTTWQLGKGRYRIFCSLTGHRAAGMEGLLEVR